VSAALRGEALAFAALAMFSANILLTKIASARLNLNVGFLISVAANIVFSTLLFGVQLALRRDPLPWDWVGFWLFVGAGLFSTWLGRWFFFESIAKLGAARASLFQVSSPLFTVVIAWLFLGERLGAASIVAMATAIVGLMLVSVSPAALARRFARTDRAQPAAAGSAAALSESLLKSGMLIGVASSAAYAVGNVFRGAGIRRWDEAILGALIGAIAAMMLQLAFGAGTSDVLRKLRAHDRPGAIMFAAGGILTISAQVCLITAMGYAPVSVVALITLCTPLLVFPGSYFLFGNTERISAWTLLGGVVTLVSIGVLVLS
jgi:drug/metabolite transporter (DMT)-like permease